VKDPASLLTTASASTLSIRPPATRYRAMDLRNPFSFFSPNPFRERILRPLAAFSRSPILWIFIFFQSTAMVFGPTPSRLRSSTSDAGTFERSSSSSVQVPVSTISRTFFAIAGPIPGTSLSSSSVITSTGLLLCSMTSAAL